MNFEDFVKQSTGQSGGASPTPNPAVRAKEDKRGFQSFVESTQQAKAPVMPTAPSFSRTKEQLETKKKDLNVLQTADLWNTRIGLNFGSSMANLIGGSIKGGVMAKDVVKGFTKDVVKDVAKGNFKDVYHQSVQGIAKVLSGLTRASVVGKDIVKGTFSDKTIDEESNADDAFDRGAKYLADALSTYAEVQKNKQVTPSEIYDQLKNDTLLDKGLKGLGDFYTDVGDDMNAVVSAKKVKYGMDGGQTLTDSILQGIGGLPLFIASGMGLKALGTTIGFSEAGAGTFASIGNVVNEAGIEANTVYEEELAKGKSEDEAISAGLNTYAGNLAIIGLSNKVDGMFSQNSYQGWRRFASVSRAALGEGGQEAVQQMISNANTDKPIMEGVRDSFIVGVVVGAPAAIAFGANPKAKTPIDRDEDFVPTEKQIIENPDLSQDQKNTLIALTNDELSDQDKVDIITEAVATDSLVKGRFEYETGSAEYEALVTDIGELIEQGTNPVDVSTELQNLTTKEGTPITPEYAQNLITDAMLRIQQTAEKTQQEVAQVQETVDEIDATTKRQEQGLSYLTNKLTEQGIEEDVREGVGRNIQVAITREGTLEEKNAAIELLSDPNNETARAIYEEEMGVELPKTAEETRTYLTSDIKKSDARGYAEMVVDYQLNNAENGYRVFLPPDATRQGDSVYGVPSTFPKWIPEELRSNKLFTQLKPYLKEGKRPPAKNTRQVRLYDLVQEETQRLEAEFLTNELNITAPTTEVNADIPFQLAHDQIESESQISMAEAEAVIRSYFTAEEVPLAFVKSIRTPRGLEAWGKYAQGVITLVENPKADTPHHEAVHATLDLFVAEQDRSRYLDAAYEDAVDRLGKEAVEKGVEDLSRRYAGKLSDAKLRAIYAEEALADGFYEYLQGRETKSILQKFYEAVVEFLRTMRGDATAQQLYKDIIARKRATAKKMKAQSQEYFVVDGKPLPLIRASQLYSEGEARALTTKLLKKLEGRTSVSKQFISDLTNAPDLKQVEKDLIRGVLATEGDKVNVAEFTDKVVAELLPLTVKASDVVNSQAEDQYADDYMVNEGGFTPKYEGITLPAEIRGEVANYVENVYETPIKTEAGRIHFDWLTRNYFGHTRIEDMADNATRRVLEVQSDLYQKGNLEKEYDPKKALNSNGEDTFESRIEREAEVAKLAQYNDPTAHFRMIREEMRRAAQDGMKVVQFPTGQTAMKIEGLGDNTRWFDPSTRAGVFPKVDLNYLKVGKEITTRNSVATDLEGDVWIITEVLGDGKFKAVPKKMWDTATNKENLKESYWNEQFDISGKIDTNNPIYRFYEKEVGRYLKSKYGITEVTDAKGVTWYEVKVDPQVAYEAIEAFSVKNRIHEEDRAVMDVFIRDVRTDKGISTKDLKAALELAEHWNINVNLPAKTIANQFEKILNDEKKVAATALYSEKEPIKLNVSKTNAKTPFKNAKIEGVPRATDANTETHDFVLGKETVKLTDATIQKFDGDTNGVYARGYAVIAMKKGKEMVVYSSPDLKNASQWLSDHVGKEVTVPKRATSSVLISGRVAHAIVTNPDVIEIEANHTAATKGITDFVFYDAQGNEIEKKVIYREPDYATTSPELVSRATANNKKVLFPRYFAVVNQQLVQVTNDDATPTTPSLLEPKEVEVDETQVTRVDREQTQETAIVPNLNAKVKVKQSRAYQKAKARAEEDPELLAEYEKLDAEIVAVRIDDQISKAFELLDTNPEYAKAVALGLEQAPLDITQAAVSIAVSQRAKDEKNYEMVAAVEQSHSLRQSRRGQEIAMERGRVDENSPEYFVRELIERRKALSEMKYKPILAAKKKFTQMLEERVTEAKKKASKKVKSDLEMKAEELDSFLASIAC